MCRPKVLLTMVPRNICLERPSDHRLGIDHLSEVLVRHFDSNRTWLSGRIWYVNSTPWMVISPRKVRSSRTMPLSISMSGRESMRLNTRCAAPAALVRLRVSVGRRRTERVEQLANQRFFREARPKVRKKERRKEGKKDARMKKQSMPKRITRTSTYQVW